MQHKFALAAIAIMAWAVVLAQPAAAGPPVHQDLPPFDSSAVLTGICAFPVTVESHLTGSQTIFFDRAGNVVRVDIDTIEQDTFTANGKTLAGLPYGFRLMLVFDPGTGELVHAYSRGVTARVPLPGGDLFLTAGRADFVDHPDDVFLLQPDTGAQGNIAGFCAALSP